MEKLIKVIDAEIRERVAKLIEDANLHENRKMKEFADYTGTSGGAVQKWREKRSTPDTSSVVAIARYFNVSPLWILTGQEEKPPVQIQNGNGNGKIAGNIHDKSLCEIDRWIKETNDGLDYGPMIKGLVAKEYPEFREWLKKTTQVIFSCQG